MHIITLVALTANKFNVDCGAVIARMEEAGWLFSDKQLHTLPDSAVDALTPIVEGYVVEVRARLARGA